jgi:hypothetical protein
MSAVPKAEQPNVIRELRGPVATLTLNRPSQYNSIPGAMIEEIRAAHEALAADEEVRVVVVAGAGKAFCAGHDLSEMVGRDPMQVVITLEPADGRRRERIVERAAHGLGGALQVVERDVECPQPPGETARADFARRVGEAAAERETLTALRDFTPKLADGTIIEVAANIGSLEEIDAALEAGAMGVGLFRTELLFMRHMHLPSEDMQAETYSALARAFAPHPVIVRTLDIGGDKPIAGIEFPEEENPFLGWRGIRMCLDRPDIFKRQLRALLRAAVHGNIKVMLPMVSDLDEVRRTKTLIEECAAELDAEGVANGPLPVGVMLETPAAGAPRPAPAPPGAAAAAPPGRARPGAASSRTRGRRPGCRRCRAPGARGPPRASGLGLGRSLGALRRGGLRHWRALGR